VVKPNAIALSPLLRVSRDGVRHRASPITYLAAAKGGGQVPALTSVLFT